LRPSEMVVWDTWMARASSLCEMPRAERRVLRMFISNHAKNLADNVDERLVAQF